jgi:hypothetical protein
LIFSAIAAETPDEKMWSKNALRRTSPQTAENPGNLRSFSYLRLTAAREHDCYTFERFAPNRQVIHTAYYYSHKRKRIGLKEEAKWS